MRRCLLALTVLLLAASPDDPVAKLLDALKTAPNDQAAVALQIRILAAWRNQATEAVQLLLDSAATAIARNDAKSAIASLDAALDLQPENADIWRQRAEARYQAADDAGALADLAQALSREPRNFAALSDLSRFAEQRGDFKRALAAWETFLQVDPSAPQGAARLEKLRHKVLGQPT